MAAVVITFFLWGLRRALGLGRNLIIPLARRMAASQDDLEDAE
jgi:hypothetical protein